MELPNIDTLYTNDEMRNMHSVSTQGGMRKSNETKSLVLITSLESTYTDRWEKDILHYTGEGLNGDQLLNRQNKTLYESNKNGITVWLYEKIEKNNYSFLGKVELADKPYQEQQPDEAGKLRKVWMFPLKASTPVKPIVPKSLIDKVAEKKEKKLRNLSKEALAKVAIDDSSRARKNIRIVSTAQHHRSEAISLCTKTFAKGVCDLCSSHAGFNDKHGLPYMECHHIEWLSKGGKDNLENTVALCPNCHRKMHVVNSSDDADKLKKIALKRKVEIVSC
jgi:5-methylcytosine-specific restriction protein A|tara:strand:- start:36 stop:869 length:834 start_codon:yes stop_codon:yes gene_type:complete